MTKRMKSLVDHTMLIEQSHALGYTKRDGGICAGYTGMIIQAGLQAGGLAQFDERLRLIEKHHNDLKQKVSKFKIKSLSISSNELSHSDRELIDIIAFFEGVELYFAPNEHPELFDKRISQFDLPQIASLITPAEIDAKISASFIECLESHVMTFDRAQLIDYLDDLKKIAKDSDEPLMIKLGNGAHAIAIGFEKYCLDSWTGYRWNFIDINRLGLNNKPTTAVINAYSSSQLADLIYQAFDDKYDSYSVIGLQYYTQASMDQELKERMAESLQSLASEHQDDTLLVESNGRQFTSLSMAAFMGLKSQVEALLNRDIDVNTVDSNKNSCLHCAVQYGDVEVVKLLTDQPHISINPINDNGLTPLHLAALNGYADIVQYLLTQKDIKKSFETSLGKTPLQLAVEEGHVEVCQCFLEHNKNQNIINNTTEAQAVMFALQNQRYDVVGCFLSHGSEKARQGLQFMAAKYGSIDLVKCFLKSVPEMGQLHHEKRVKLLTDSVKHGNLHIAYYLLTDGVLVDKDDLSHIDLLIAAIESNESDFMHFLKASVEINKANSNGETPLYTVVQSGDLKAVLQLLVFGADVNQRLENGDSPLELAIRMGRRDLVEQLIIQGADLNYENEHGVSPLLQAAFTDNEKLVDFILNNGCNTKYIKRAVDWFNEHNPGSTIYPMLDNALKNEPRVTKKQNVFSFFHQKESQNNDAGQEKWHSVKATFNSIALMVMSYAMSITEYLSEVANLV